MIKINHGDDPDLARLAAAGRERIDSLGTSEEHPPGRPWLLVDVAGQRLARVHTDWIELIGSISTALAGIDCRQDSEGTPCGLHRIAEKIGAGALPGSVFISRQPTGQRWTRGQQPPDDSDLILTRILTLDGMEEGLNRGSGVDSLARYIYIHGTNHEHLIGTPVSHGCIRMTNKDVMELFELVEPGDPVFIA